jgi:hypothetical protein
LGAGTGKNFFTRLVLEIGLYSANQLPPTSQTSAPAVDPEKRKWSNREKSTWPLSIS